MDKDKQLVEWLGEDNDIGQDIWHHKYQYNNETFDEWLDRISAGNKELRDEIEAKRFLFGGRILANRGLYKDGVKVTYSNCYVLPAPEDNIESIYDTAGKLARTFSYGGGVGIDISKLAPKGAKVNNTAKETSGAVSFMDLYGMTTELIGQNGRRGALMISISCDHPDLEEFIDIKSDLDKVTSANISVRVTDAFMRAVENNEDIELTYDRKEVGQTISKKVNARKLFKKLAYNNWDMGEPGILFWDKINNWNLLSEDDDFEYAGTNPCAEEPLPAGGSCLLGSINLSEFVKYPYTKNAYIDTPALKNTVGIAIKALNDVLDEGLPLHPLQIQRDTVRDWRQIGLGVFGIADMLIKMGLEYGSENAEILCGKIAETIAKESIFTSSELACMHGKYPAWNDSVLKSEYLKNILEYDEALDAVIYHQGLRNSQLLTIAPTGSLSTMLQVSGGIEPYFATGWQRTTKSLHGEDVIYTERPKAINELMEHLGIDKDSELPDYVVTSSNIRPLDRIRMQRVWQEYIDASISSTINLPYDTTPEEVENIYIEAWKNGLKGVTVFRDGCRRVGILTTSDNDEDNNEPTKPTTFGRGDVIDISDDLVGKKRKLITGCGSLHCLAYFDPITGDLMEIYLNRGSTGGCANFMTGLSRMVSHAARLGGDIDGIIDQLNSCGVCPSYATRRATKHDTSKGSCCPIAVGYALKDMWLEMQDELGLLEKPSENVDVQDVISEIDDKYNLKINKPTCPECGEELIFEGGCISCRSCGFSKCD